MQGTEPAQKYIRKYGEITSQNYRDFVKWANEKALKELATLREKGYNMGVIDYAISSDLLGKYDETLTEFIVKEKLK